MKSLNTMLTYVEYTLVIFSLSAMSIITFMNVVTRYFISYSLSFTEEVTVNLFVLLIFTGTAIGIHRKAHLGFSLLFDLAKGSIKILIALLIGLISIIIFSLIAYYSFEMIQFQMKLNQKSPALGMPQWIFSLGLLIGGILCLIRSIQVTVVEIITMVKERVKAS
jgi:C4-dicarboxylate transporter DctQ subunit